MGDLEGKFESLRDMMQSLLDRVYDEQMSLSRTSSLPDESFIRRMRRRQKEIQELADENMVLAPEQAMAIRENLRIINEKIRDYIRATGEVRSSYSPPARYVLEIVPQFRPVNDALCQYARTITGENPTQQFTGYKTVYRRVG